MPYDENGRPLIASKAEIEEAKYRVSLKRKIRQFIPKALWAGLRDLDTRTLENMTF